MSCLLGAPRAIWVRTLTSVGLWVSLLASATAWVMASPQLFSSIQSVTSGSTLLLPFLLLVPTVMSTLYQVAEVHRAHVDL